MKLFDKDVVTLATWASTTNETGTLIHYSRPPTSASLWSGRMRAVRPITEWGIRMLLSDMA